MTENNFRDAQRLFNNIQEIKAFKASTGILMVAKANNIDKGLTFGPHGLGKVISELIDAELIRLEKAFEEI